MTAVAATERSIAVDLLEQRAAEPAIRVQTDTVSLLLFTVGAWTVRQHLFQLCQILHAV